MKILWHSIPPKWEFTPYGKSIPEPNLSCQSHGLMMPMPDWGGRCWYCAFDEAKERLAEFPLREDET